MSKKLSDSRNIFEKILKEKLYLFRWEKSEKKSRIILPQYGGFLSFASAESSSAPGQIPYEELHEKIYDKNFFLTQTKLQLLAETR